MTAHFRRFPLLTPPTNDRSLPAPTIKGPLHACERAVFVEDVKEGASVHLFRNGTQYAAACFDYSSLWFRITDPLQEGESHQGGPTVSGLRVSRPSLYRDCGGAGKRRAAPRACRAVLHGHDLH